jgi:AcrR family transcriptional regulator
MTEYSVNIGGHMVRSRQINEQMRAESQAKLLAAARQVFATQGYFNCTVSDIARQAGMSQGNLYWYYPSKEELLKAVLADGFDKVEQVLIDAEGYPGEALARIEYLIARYLEHSHSAGDFFAIFMSLLGHGGTPLLQQMGLDPAEIGARYHQHLSTILAQARAEGVVADVDPNILAVFFFSFINGLLITYGKDWTMVPEMSIRQALLRMLGSPAT